MHVSTAISRLADQNTILAQRLALMQQRLEQHAGEAGDSADSGGERPAAIVGEGAELDAELMSKSSAELVSERTYPA